MRTFDGERGAWESAIGSSEMLEFDATDTLYPSRRTTAHPHRIGRGGSASRSAHGCEEACGAKAPGSGWTRGSLRRKSTRE